MNLVNSYMMCSRCETEFNRQNYPVTLLCGHNVCFKCISSLSKKNYVCDRDNIKQDLPESPSLDYLNFIETAKSIPGLYRPPIQIKSSKLQVSFNPSPSKKDKICKFYLKGTCKFGQKCWNGHPYRFN